MKTNQRNTRYPRFALYWRLSSGEVGRYYTRRKKSIMYRLDGLYKATEAYFKLFYSSENKNESRVYKLPTELKQLKHDWTIFSAKDEIESCMDTPE